ncbi:MAG: 4'-phosphopantetheinyl transferase [Pseudohongiella sp.]|nr:MAG: 4'-phosphopantetheinyl transferase [Pseudohongiella sp.]
MTTRQIAESEIHLWQIYQGDFELSAVQDECLEWLTEPELSRYRRFQFDRHRKQLLLGRVLTRAALSHYDSSVSPSQWNFGHNKYGKPEISEKQNANSLYFNLSHSAGRVALAVSRIKEIGIDIEFAGKPRRVAALTQRYFSELEAAEILSLPQSEQQSRFYDLWTLKEAYIKACGMGLAIPLQHFSYGFPGDEGLTVGFDAQRNDDADAWQLWQLAAGADYRLALAAKAGVGSQSHEIVGWRMKGLNEVVPQAVSVVRHK